MINPRRAVRCHFWYSSGIELLGLFAAGLFKFLYQAIPREVVRGERWIDLATVVEHLGDAAAVALSGDLHGHLHAYVGPVIRENRYVFPLLAGIIVFHADNAADQ